MGVLNACPHYAHGRCRPDPATFLSCASSGRRRLSQWKRLPPLPKPIVVLDTKEIRELKVNADAYSFDYDEGFIEMCLDIERYHAGTSENGIRLVSVD